MEERKKYLTASLVLTALEKQRKLVAIKSLTEEQMQAVKNSDNESFLNQMVDLINKKQQKIEEINTLDRNFEKVYNELDELISLGKWQDIAQHSDPQLRELYNILEQNKKIMQEIQKIDIGNSNKMRDNLHKIQLKLKQVRQGKKVISGYEGGYGPMDACFVDKKR